MLVGKPIEAGQRHDTDWGMNGFMTRNGNYDCKVVVVWLMTAEHGLTVVANEGPQHYPS